MRRSNFFALEHRVRITSRTHIGTCRGEVLEQCAPASSVRYLKGFVYMSGPEQEQHLIGVDANTIGGVHGSQLARRVVAANSLDCGDRAATHCERRIEMLKAFVSACFERERFCLGVASGELEIEPPSVERAQYPLPVAIRRSNSGFRNRNAPGSDRRIEPNRECARVAQKPLRLGCVAALLRQRRQHNQVIELGI